MGPRSFLLRCWPPVATWRAASLVGMYLPIVMAMAACDPGGQLRGAGGCPALPCQSAVTANEQFAAAASDLASLDLKFCRNQVCVHSSLSPSGSGSSGATFSCDASGPLSTSCQVVPSGSGQSATALLSLKFSGRLEDFQDGDAYTIQVGKPSGPLLLNINKQIQYEPAPGKSSGCPVQCLSASL